jgi:hypothetical protein
MVKRAGESVALAKRAEMEAGSAGGTGGDGTLVKWSRGPRGASSASRAGFVDGMKLL